MTKQVGRWTVAALTLLAVACAGGVGSQTQPEPSGEPEEQAATAPSSAASSPPAEGSARAGAHSEADDGEADDGPEGTIPHFADGQLQGLVTRAQARQRGLTLVELGDEWTPRIFDEDESLGASGRQPFRRRFIRLSNEDGRRGERDPSKNYLELFGIFPTLNVMRQRLADEERHACHEAVDDAPIEALEEALRPGADMPGQRRRANAIRWLRNRLERVAERRELESIDELADDRRWGRDLRRMRQLEERVAAIRSVQAHLRCEGFLHERASEDVLDAWTGRALRAWQSKHMIISLASRVDEATRQTLATDSEELDLLSLLRVLRERVVDATGVIEDGSASNQWGTVLGRQLQVDDEFRWVDRLEPLPGGAPDRVSEATEAAARALGWTDAESALAWLNEHAPERTESLLVALPLPEPPPYHSEHMELRAEIDRGDVWYSFPYTDDGRPRGYPVRRRPTLVLYARHEGRDVPLVRWNTTIGSWQPEINPEDGSVGMR